MMHPVSYRILDARTHYRVGHGVTVDMSSDGVLFAANQQLPVGKRIELSIHWPAQLDGRCPLKLVTTGRIVRVENGRVAVHIDKYEFRIRSQTDRGTTAAD